MFGFKFGVSHLLTGAGLMALSALPVAANAAVVITATYSAFGAPAVSGPVKTIDLTGLSGPGTFNFNSGVNAITVKSFQNGAIVAGSVENQYAAPVDSTGTKITTPYFSTGAAPGYFEVTFASLQSYFGLLWGSIGDGDYLQFFNGNTSLGTVTGVQAKAAAVNFNDANGARDFGGSQYTLINLAGGQFNKIVLGQTAGPSFESGNFEYAAVNVAAPVPEPVTMALLGAGLVGVGLVRRRRNAAA